MVVARQLVSFIMKPMKHSESSGQFLLGRYTQDLSRGDR